MGRGVQGPCERAGLYIVILVAEKSLYNLSRTSLWEGDWRIYLQVLMKHLYSRLFLGESSWEDGWNRGMLETSKRQIFGNSPCSKGTITHSGTASVGHYQAYVRSCCLAVTGRSPWGGTLQHWTMRNVFKFIGTKIGYPRIEQAFMMVRPWRPISTILRP